MVASPRSVTPALAEPHGHAREHAGHAHHDHAHHHAGHVHTPAAPRSEPRPSLIALSGLQRLGLALPVIGTLWLLTFWAMSHA